MMHCRLEVDNGNAGMSHECADHGISAFFFPVFQLRKRTYANRRTVTLEYAHKLSDVLSLITIHHDTVTMFKCPGCAARLEYYRLTTQLIHRHLHRSARSQARIKENERNRLPSEWL